MQHANFVHLHVHTQYSLLDGAIRVGDLVERARQYRMPAMAISDHGNMFGALEFYTKAHAAGVKPIIGCEVYVAPGSRHEKSGAASSGDASGHLVLLCKNRTGYRNLCRMVSTAYQDGFYYRPRIDWDLLSDHNEGLIALTACLGGEIPSLISKGRMDQALLRAGEFSKVFDRDRFYLELQQNFLPEQEPVNRGLIEIGKELGLPVVATNDCHYLTRDDAFAHEVLLCIQTGKTLDDPNRMRFANEEFYVKTPEEMVDLFKDVPEAISNTVEIAERCNLELDVSGKNYHFPVLPLEKGQTPSQALEEQSLAGLEQRVAEIRKIHPEFSSQDVAAYKERLEEELQIINQMGFPDYFLIVADFINWAKNHDIPVGPGRGSAAGSLVAYALKITDIDPIPYHLLFERFLNPERISMPDIDVDFCINGREEVINYVRNKYGRENVAQIITFGSMLARAVIRDVGRGMGMPYGEVDVIAKLIPNPTGKKVTLKDAQKQEPRLRELIEKDSRVRKLFDVALSLEGLTRHASTHAAGVVVTPEPLTNYLPLYVDPKSQGQVTQYDMGFVEKIGLVKFDFLGLKTLTVINNAVRLIRQGKTPDFDLNLIPNDDQKTFQLLSRGETTGVFQLESSGMKEYLIKLKPSCFEDLIAMVALYRPGPLGSGMVDSFIKRKHGVEEFGFDFPQLEPILKDTYGVIVYQEQVMQIAQALGNYTLGGADLLRRAMGKKKPEEMAKQKKIFLDGAKEGKLDIKKAEVVFDQMEKFAEYGFNKCLHGDTRIMDADTGLWHSVEDLFKHKLRPRVHACDEEYKLVPRKVEDVVWNGVKPLFRLRTRSGREILATGNHPFRTMSGWVNLEDLNIGDRVAQARSLLVENTTTWPRHELIVLAGLLSEGNTCHPANLFFYNNDDTLIMDFAEASERFPNTAARISCYDGVRKEVCLKRVRNVPWNSPDFGTNRYCGARLWAEQLCILNKTATEKTIPEEVFSLCDADIELFVGRLWSGDGSLKLEHTSLFYSTSSLLLADGLVRLLLRLGIHARIHRKSFRYRGGIKPGYAVHLIGERSIQQFARRVLPNVVGRADDCVAISQHVLSVKGRSSRDTVPAEVRKIVNAARIDQGMTWVELETASGCSMREFTGNGSSVKKGFRHGIIAQIANTLDEEQLAALATSDIVWDAIESIEYEGDFDTYDLQVEEHHNFVAEGLVVHNSHSAAYAFIAYQTAFLKARYPVEFMAALLTEDMENTDKVIKNINEIRNMGISILPPDINESSRDFTVHSNDIRFGLGAVKGVGGAAVEAIVEARAAGPFESLHSFCERVDLRRVNKRVVEALIKCGAFDSLQKKRAQFMAALEEAMEYGQKFQREKESGQESLFGSDQIVTQNGHAYGQLPDLEEWPENVLLTNEKEAIGFYITGHPLARHSDAIRRFSTCDTAGLSERADKEEVSICGIVTGIKLLNTRKGDRMAFVTLEDLSGFVEMVVFPETYTQAAELLNSEQALLVKGSVDVGEDACKILVNEVLALKEVQERLTRMVHFRLTTPGLEERQLRSLKEIMTRYRGECDAMIHLVVPNRSETVISLPEELRLQASDELMDDVEKLFGYNVVTFE